MASGDDHIAGNVGALGMGEAAFRAWAGADWFPTRSDHFPFGQNGLASPEIDVGGRQVGNALMM
jgi:hypothetical protein